MQRFTLKCSSFPIFILTIAISNLRTVSSLISLRTQTSIPLHLDNDGRSPYAKKEYVLGFLATASNWPKIVLSSVGVEDYQELKSSTIKTKGNEIVNRPMRKGEKVDEIFGLPPILPLSVTWECVETNSKLGVLDVRSKDGLKGIASDCRMLFEFKEATENKNKGSNTKVDINLVMEYEPQNILGVLAIPILTIDNAIALKVLLPNVLKNDMMKKSQEAAEAAITSLPLDKFRSLMGTLYGIAGLAHFVDSILGQSTLLSAAGLGTFYELPGEGKALVLLWCFAGPLAYIASKTVESHDSQQKLKISLADLGLIGYGLTEIICSGIARFSSTTSITETALDPLMNAILVQIIVAASWIYSSKKVE